MQSLALGMDEPDIAAAMVLGETPSNARVFDTIESDSAGILSCAMS